jgi:WD40 repeat protein
MAALISAALLLTSGVVTVGSATIERLQMTNSKYPNETQLTHGPGGRILTNCNVWSPDGKWIVYDTRSDPVGGKFDGMRIEMVNVDTGDVRKLYESKRGAHCGVVTFSPKRNQVVFILGPEDPTPDWQYGAAHRQGVVVDLEHLSTDPNFGSPNVVPLAQPPAPSHKPLAATNLDARDIVPPYTAGALRGGSHVHVFSPDGEWVSFTYDDHVLSALTATPLIAGAETNQRNIGVSVCGAPVHVLHKNERNHDGDSYSVLVTNTVEHPDPGSDQIQRAFEEGWIGSHGYTKGNGTRQKRAIAFHGEVMTKSGMPISEIFIVDIPDDVRAPGESGPLQGTETTRPRPPHGTLQRRVTYTADRKYPGIQGPRHWLRSSPDGAYISCLMKDDEGVVQLWLVATAGGEPPRQLTHDTWSINSTISWRPDGKRIAYAADNSIFSVDVQTGKSNRLTERTSDADAPLPIACVYSPDGKTIAYERNLADADGATRSNQVFVVSDINE